MSRARDLAALVTPNLFNQNEARSQVGLGTSSIGAKIQVSGAVSATTYYGDGSNLTGIALSAASSQEIKNINISGIATINNLNVTGISTFGGNVHIGGSVFDGSFHNSTFTGITTVNSLVSLGGTTGKDGQFIVHNGEGLEWEYAPGIRSDFTYTNVAAGTTEFDFVHDPAGIDVYLNGVKLPDSQFYSDGGSKVFLNVGADQGDVLQLVGFGVTAGPNLAFQSLTIKGNGNIYGDIGNIKVLEFQGSDLEFVGASNSATVLIPPRKGFVETKDVRRQIGYIDVGAAQTTFSHVGIATTNNRSNTDLFINGIKQLPDVITYNVPNRNEIQLQQSTFIGDEIEIIGYPEGVRVSSSQTTTRGLDTYYFPIGIGSQTDTKPLDVYINGVKYSEVEDYFLSFGDIVRINQITNNVDKIDAQSYKNQDKVGLTTVTVGAGVSIIDLTKELFDYDVIVNGIKLAPSQGGYSGIGSVLRVTLAPHNGSQVNIISYENSKTGVATITAGAGQTVFYADEDITAANSEVFVNGVRLHHNEFTIADPLGNAVGVGTTVVLTVGTYANDIVDIFKYASYAITGVTTSVTGIGVTNFAGIGTGVTNNEVFVNGVKLAPSEFNSIGTGNTIQLTIGSLDNDIVTIVGLATTASTVFNETGDGSKHVFDITHHNGENIVFLDGIKLNKSEYSTFAPDNYALFDQNFASGDTIEIFEYADYTRTGVTTVTAGAGQTNFTVGIPTAVPDNDVYVNGVLLSPDEYSVLGAGNTIQLDVGSGSGDIVEIVGIATTARTGIITSHTITDNRNVIPVTDSSGYIEVYNNGVKLIPSQYTKDESDTTLTIEFNVASLFDDETIEIVEYNKDGSQERRVDSKFTAYEGQTEFPAIYTEGLIDVFVNGVKLIRKHHYTDTSGIVITLHNALRAGDEVELITYAPKLAEDWQRNATGVYTLSNVGIGTTYPRYKLEVGNVGAAGTQLWVNADARITGVLTVGPDSVVVDGIRNQVLVGSGLTIESNIIRVGSSLSITESSLAINGSDVLTSTSLNIPTGIVTANTFVGTISSATSAEVATVALGFTGDGSINTTGIITAGSFIGTATHANEARVALGFTNNANINTTGIITSGSLFATTSRVTNLTVTGTLTGTASTATEALSLTSNANINTTGIITATFIGDLTGVASTATVANGLSSTASVNTSGVITATSFSGALIGNVFGTASIAQVALALTTNGSVNTSGIITAASFTGDLTGTASTASALTASATGSDLTLSSDLTVTGSGTSTTQLSVTGVSTFIGVSTFKSNAQFTDNIILYFGNDNDLEIKSDGSNGYIRQHTSSLSIYSDELYLRNNTNNEPYLKGVVNGSVELYYDNSKKFETTNDGISITGIATATSFSGDLTGTATTATTALSVDTNASLDLIGIVTAAAFVSEGDVSLLGDNNILGIGTGYSVGVGTHTPAADAILELKSTDKFFIVPRMTTAQRDGVASTTAGAIVFNTTVGKHQGWDGSSWNNFYL